MTNYQELMQDEPIEELSPAEVQALSEPWETESESDQELLTEVMEVIL